MRVSGSMGRAKFTVTSKTPVTSLVSETVQRVPPPSLSVDTLRSEVWADVDFTHQTTWQDFDQRTSTEVSRRDRIHRWLLYVVLGLLFFETLLAWHFGHQR